jgi:hypothetical protein
VAAATWDISPRRETVTCACCSRTAPAVCCARRWPQGKGQGSGRAPLGPAGAGRSNHNKAACALANKLARICYATLRDKEPFGEQTVRLSKKIKRESFVMPA